MQMTRCLLLQHGVRISIEPPLNNTISKAQLFACNSARSILSKTAFPTIKTPQMINWLYPALRQQMTPSTTVPLFAFGVLSARPFTCTHRWIAPGRVAWLISSCIAGERPRAAPVTSLAPAHYKCTVRGRRSLSWSLRSVGTIYLMSVTRAGCLDIGPHCLFSDNIASDAFDTREVRMFNEHCDDPVIWRWTVACLFWISSCESGEKSMRGQVD